MARTYPVACSGVRQRNFDSGNETLNLNQDDDEIAATQARLSGTRTKINYTAR
ncbi:MAG TPA: hypothetical protein VKL21_01495 [Candidatus Methanoperedens sp.]|nr:hypothetical protein [Candidatus Methanoperedens sp.]